MAKRSGGASQLATLVWLSSHDPAALMWAASSASPRRVALASALLIRPQDQFSLKLGSRLTDSDPVTLASTSPLQLKFFRKSRGSTRAACRRLRRAGGATAGAAMVPPGTASEGVARTGAGKLLAPPPRPAGTLPGRALGGFRPTSAAPYSPG